MENRYLQHKKNLFYCSKIEVEVLGFFTAFLLGDFLRHIFKTILSFYFKELNTKYLMQYYTIDILYITQYYNFQVLNSNRRA